MERLTDHVKYAVKGAVQDNGAQYVLIETASGTRHRRRIMYKYFSNFPIEFVRFGTRTYQVNDVKELYK